MPDKMQSCSAGLDPASMLSPRLLQAWCMSESDSDFEMLEKRLEALTPDESILVTTTHRAWHMHPPTPTPLPAAMLLHTARGCLLGAGFERFLPASQPAQRDGGVHHRSGGEGCAPRRGARPPACLPLVCPEPAPAVIDRAGCVCGPLVFVQVEQATRSTNKSLQRLVNLKGLKPEDIYETLCKQTVGLVFTAHPTQVQGGWESGARD